MNKDVKLYGTDLLINDSKLIDAITSLNVDISEAITLLSTTLSAINTASGGITWLQLLSAIFVAFTGALSAYLFNLFHWRMVEKKQKISRTGGALNSLINELEIIAIDYWVKGYVEENKNEIHVTEISIKSKLFIISKYIKNITSKLNSNEMKSTKQKLENFNSGIFDLVTGDKFESKSRKASKSMALLISKRCSIIKAELSSLDF